MEHDAENALYDAIEIMDKIEDGIDALCGVIAAQDVQEYTNWLSYIAGHLYEEYKKASALISTAYNAICDRTGETDVEKQERTERKCCMTC